MEERVIGSGVSCCVTLPFVTHWVQQDGQYESELSGKPRFTLKLASFLLKWHISSAVGPSVWPSDEVYVLYTIDEVRQCQFCELTEEWITFYLLTYSHVASLHSQSEQAILWGSFRTLLLWLRLFIALFIWQPVSPPSFSSSLLPCRDGPTSL